MLQTEWAENTPTTPRRAEALGRFITQLPPLPRRHDEESLPIGRFLAESGKHLEFAPDPRFPR